MRAARRRGAVALNKRVYWPPLRSAESGLRLSACPMSQHGSYQAPAHCAGGRWRPDRALLEAAPTLTHRILVTHSGSGAADVLSFPPLQSVSPNRGQRPAGLDRGPLGSEGSRGQGPGEGGGIGVGKRVSGWVGDGGGVLIFSSCIFKGCFCLSVCQMCKHYQARESREGQGHVGERWERHLLPAVTLGYSAVGKDMIHLP